MPLTPVPIDQFGGLDLRKDPLDVGPSRATLAYNTDFDTPGRVRCRDGTVLAKAVSTMSAGYDLATFDTAGGTHQWLVGGRVGASLKYQAYTGFSAATLVASSAAVSSGSISAARWGDPSFERLYIANGVDTLWRWDGAAFTQPAGMPAARWLTVQPADNRLVAANGSNFSRVWFSDAGAPETWNLAAAGNWVDLAPGDGSGITGLTTWGQNVFAFKRERFFVFTGNSVSNTGSAKFNYRPVNGYGSVCQVAGGDEGVYFFDGRHIWLTTGGTPVKVSGDIEPFLLGTVPLSDGATDFVFDTRVPGNVKLFYSLGRLFVSFVTTDPVIKTLMYDPGANAWALWSWSLIGMDTGSDASARSRTHFFDASRNVYTYIPGDPYAGGLDGSFGMAWVYRSGKYAVAEPGRVAVVNETKLVGTGTVTMTINTDKYGDSASPSTVLGSSTPTEGWPAGIDQEGQVWQYELIGTGGGSVDRIVHYVSSVKPAGLG